MKTERIPWVLTPEALKPYAPGVWDPGRGPRRAVLPARRLHAGEGPGRRAPGEGPGAQGAVLAGGRAVQGAAPAGDAVDVLRDAAADPGADQVRVPGRRAERDVGDDPADLQPLVLDQRRPRRARGWRRGCDRRRGRPPRWLHPLRQGRQAHAHLLDDGRVRLQAGRRGEPADRRGDGPHGVRGGRSEAGDRRRGDPVHRRPTGRQGTDGPHRAHPLLRLRGDGHRPGQRWRRRLAATRTRSRSRSPAR